MGLCDCEEDRILIKNLYEFKGYRAKRLMKEFPTKRWKKITLNNFWNIWKNNVRMLGSAVAEDREILVQQQTPATATTLFWARKALPRCI